jgi:hypothetical protein
MTAHVTGTEIGIEENDTEIEGTVGTAAADTTDPAGIRPLERIPVM